MFVNEIDTYTYTYIYVYRAVLCYKDGIVVKRF